MLSSSSSLSDFISASHQSLSLYSSFVYMLMWHDSLESCINSLIARPLREGVYFISLFQGLNNACLRGKNRRLLVAERRLKFISSLAQWSVHPGVNNNFTQSHLGLFLVMRSHRRNNCFKTRNQTNNNKAVLLDVDWCPSLTRLSHQINNIRRGFNLKSLKGVAKSRSDHHIWLMMSPSPPPQYYHRVRDASSMMMENEHDTHVAANHSLNDELLRKALSPL